MRDAGGEERTCAGCGREIEEMVVVEARRWKRIARREGVGDRDWLCETCMRVKEEVVVRRIQMWR